MKKCENCKLFDKNKKDCTALKHKSFREYMTSKNNKCKFYKEAN